MSSTTCSFLVTFYLIYYIYLSITLVMLKDSFESSSMIGLRLTKFRETNSLGHTYVLLDRIHADLAVCIPLQKTRANQY